MSDRKYNPRTDDPMYWRYQKLVEDWADTMSGKLKLIGPYAENFRIITAYLARQLYEMGYNDAERLFKEVMGDGEEDKGKVIN